jgi:hypothetical protein
MRAFGDGEIFLRGSFCCVKLLKRRVSSSGYIKLTFILHYDIIRDKIVLECLKAV